MERYVYVPESMCTLDVIFEVCLCVCVCVCVFVCEGKDENVLSNLRQYGLQDHYLDVLVADAARNVWREGELFDAIITDRM